MILTHNDTRMYGSRTRNIRYSEEEDAWHFVIACQCLSLSKDQRRTAHQQMAGTFHGVPYRTGSKAETAAARTLLLEESNTT